MLFLPQSMGLRRDKYLSVRQCSTPPRDGSALPLEMHAQLASLTSATMRDVPTSCSPQQRDVLCSGAKRFFVLVSSVVCIRAWLLCITWLENGFVDVVTRVQGTVCLLNASRCGRIHCYLTGPFFIVGAVTSLGYGIGLLPFGPSGWKWIGDIAIIGAIVLTCIPELFWPLSATRSKLLPNQSMKPTAADGKR